jgi:hypothetical protein
MWNMPDKLCGASPQDNAHKDYQTPPNEVTRVLRHGRISCGSLQQHKQGRGGINAASSRSRRGQQQFEAPAVFV